jgi:hypothetical protein
MMQVLAPIPFVMTIDTFYLLVPNHPHFEAFPLYQSHYRKLELEKSGQATMVFQFKNMYVHPQMKTIAPLQYPGYVPTAMLFLPIPLFAELNRLPMVIHMHFRLVHHYTIAYEFMFEAMRPMLGHCGDSVYCVRLYHD